MKEKFEHEEEHESNNSKTGIQIHEICNSKEICGLGQSEKMDCDQIWSWSWTGKQSPKLIEKAANLQFRYDLQSDGESEWRNGFRRGWPRLHARDNVIYFVKLLSMNIFQNYKRLSRFFVMTTIPPRLSLISVLPLRSEDD